MLRKASRPWASDVLVASPFVVGFGISTLSLPKRLIPHNATTATVCMWIGIRDVGILSRHTDSHRSNCTVPIELDLIGVKLVVRLVDRCPLAPSHPFCRHCYRGKQKQRANSHEEFHPMRTCNET